MVTVEIETTVRLCDYCKQDAHCCCQVCGKDLCMECRGTVALFNPIKGEIDPFGCHIRRRITAQYSDDIFYGSETKEAERSLSLCPKHYFELRDHIGGKLMVSFETGYGEDVKR